MSEESLLAAGTATPAPVDATAPVGHDAAAPDAPAAPTEPTAKAESTPASSAPAAEGAPDAYAEFTVPDGAQLPPELVSEIGEFAKGLNLPQGKAQQVADLAGKAVLASQQQQIATVATLHADWRAQCQADKDFGGSKLDENLARAKAAMQATASPQLQVLLDKSGLGNHPDVIRHFLKVAPAFLPDTFMPGGKAPAGKGAGAQAIYANSNMNP